MPGLPKSSSPNQLPQAREDTARANANDAAPKGPARDVVDYELLFDCVHCGLCLESCPTYVLTRAEMDSPRGRIYLMKALAEGKLDLDADAVRHFDLCLECRGCETACPSGVHYGRLIERAREYVELNYRRGWRERMRNRLIGAIFPYPERLRWLLAPLKVIERAGLRGLLQRLTPPAMRAWLEILPPLVAAGDGNASERADTVPGAPVGADSITAAVHHGCVAQVLSNSENLNSERALAAAGYRVVRLEGIVCCGALDLHHGNIARARELARQNVRAIKKSGAEAVISAASGCAAAMAAYGELLKDDPDFTADARAVSERVADLSSLVIERGESGIPFAADFPVTVTYHDSCHLAHALGVREAPRQLLKSIPGVRLIEMNESDLCCGSAGSYNLTEREMASALVMRKADNIVATGADYVVLANPGCEFQIAAELRRRGAKTRVIHIADFLALAGRAAASPHAQAIAPTRTSTGATPAKSDTLPSAN